MKAIKKRSYLEKDYFRKRNSRFINKNLKNKRITAEDFTKKSGKTISKVLIQEGSEAIFGKIYNIFSLKNERLAIR